MESNAYSKINEGTTSVVNKFKDFFMRNLLIIVLLFNIALEIVSKLYRIGFSNPFSVEFFLELAVSTTTSMIVYICFIPLGKIEEKKQNPSFSQNLTLWGQMSDIVRNGYNELFRAFCVEQLEVERQDKRRAIIGNNTLISFSIYEEKYKGLSKAEISALVKSGEITKKEAKAINQANGNGFVNLVKVRPINPVIILSGVKKMQINDAGRTDSAYTINWLISRPFIIFATNAVLSAITTSFIGGWQNAILDMFLSVLMILLASICGYGVGVNSIRRDNDIVKSRILFISLFTEKNRISVKN